MTKIILSPSVLLYRQAIAELVNRVYEQNLASVADRQFMKEYYPVQTDIPELWLPGLLMPPRIEMLWPDICLKNGKLDGIIQINTSEEYGVMSVYVILEDDEGNPIESDYAVDNDALANHWAYFPSAALPSGTTVIVRAIAMDRLGGVGIQTESVIV
jgi:hypothetical protein